MENDDVLSNEDLLVRAVKNLRRKINFHELHDDLKSGELSEEEYDGLIKNNFDKYVIEMRDATKDEAWRVGLIVHRMNLGDEVTVDEVEEMFGLNLSRWIKMK